MKSIKFLREVLARRAAVTGAVAAILSLLVNQGWLGVDLSAKVNGGVTTAFVIAGILGTVLVVRPDVTPNSDPRDKNGNHLVPEPNPEDVVAVHDTTNQDGLQEEYASDPAYDTSDVADEDVTAANDGPPSPTK